VGEFEGDVGVRAWRHEAKDVLMREIMAEQDLQ
jgi:hypothetical protein